MKAMVYTRYGNPDVLELKEVPKPSPARNEVLVKIHAASVNSWDWDLLRGQPFLTRLGGIRRPRFNVLGADIAGRVEAVGDDVDRLQPGDEVFGDISGCRWGGFAEYVCAGEHALSLKPAGIRFEEAAALPQAGVLALQGLRIAGPIRKGYKVLLNGAGGGVGTFALQLAKSCGAEVTAVDKAGKLSMLRAMGADKVIDYTQEDFVRNGQHHDVILDVAGYRPIRDYRQALTPNGTYVMIGGATRRIFEAMLPGLLTNRTEGKKTAVLIHKPSRSDQDMLIELFEAGKIKPAIDRRFALAETAEALRYLGEGRAIGKVVITMDA